MTDDDAKNYLHVRYHGGSMDGHIERLLTFGALPETVVITLWGAQNERSILRERSLVGKEVYRRNRRLDEEGNLARPDRLGYMLERVELRHRSVVRDRC